MMRRYFIKIMLVAVGICALLALSGVLLAQGRSEDALTRAIEVQQRHTDELMAEPGVVGTAVGSGQGAQPVVLVLLEAGGVPGIPENLEGVPVRLLVTGKIYALPKPSGKPGGGGGGSLSPTSTWPRPVPIGVSTGNAGECSAGTISCRVKDASGAVYALSNNHVYALENNAPIGSNVLQPGLYDTSCVYDASDVIGTLFDFEPIVFSTSANNTIDAAIASTTTLSVGNATPSDGYGTPKSTTVGAYLNQGIQKYGRTTSLTKGNVVAINATINIGYSSGTARFINQIIVYGSRGAFIKPGDSGSLLVSDPGKNPVGLLFAGDSSGKYGIANPIDPVLARFGVTVDGQ